MSCWQDPRQRTLEHSLLAEEDYLMQYDDEKSLLQSTAVGEAMSRGIRAAVENGEYHFRFLQSEMIVSVALPATLKAWCETKRVHYNPHRVASEKVRVPQLCPDAAV